MTTPPKLLPGISAHRWHIVLFLFQVAIVVSLVSWIWTARIGIVFTLILVVAWGACARAYRRAAYTERAAGYTTSAGDYAEVVLFGKGATPVYRFFSIAELWRLDPATGAVIRGPTAPERAHKLGLGTL